MVTLFREELFFEILFVMTESVGAPSSMAFQKTLFLFWIDIAQVIRVLCSPVYGWSAESYHFIKHVDLVYDFASLVSRIAPRYTLFCLSSFLVLLALGDTALAGRQFRNSAKVTMMWPIKLLKLLVNTTVTILFSSVLKWLLMPVDCLVSKEASISSYLHDEEGLCSPWDFPDVLISSFTMLATPIYIVFAVLVCSLNFETNLLARGARSQSTGRVEVLWMVSKVAVTMLLYLCRYIQNVTCAVLLLLLMTWTLYQHLSILPFHRHETNLIRGGAFLCVTWLALSTLLVSAVTIPQAQQWILLSLIPVFFVLGACLTQWVRNRIDRSIERLRAEFDAHGREQRDREQMALEAGSPLKSAANDPEDRGRSAMDQVQASSWEKFYDPTWESRKAFRSEARVRVLLNTLLYRRDKNDVPLLLHLLKRAMQEYPDSISLRIYEILVVRFVKQDQNGTSALERRYHIDKKALALDLRYVLFALERTKFKESAGASLGKGNFSVVNVMEFDAGMDKATKSHIKCVGALRKFWGATRQANRPERRQLMIDEMLQQMKRLDVAIEQATREYSSLVEMYPTSTTLLNTYAIFCETVLNDVQTAAKLKAKALSVENYTDPYDTAFLANDDAASTYSGSGTGPGTNSRGKTLMLWRTALFKGERLQLASLLCTVRGIMLLLIALLLGGYLAVDRLLLSGIADTNIESMLETVEFEVDSTLVMDSLREMHLAAHAGDAALVNASSAQVFFYALDVKHHHMLHYQHVASHAAKDFFSNAFFAVQVPGGAGWLTESFSFWNLINEWCRRAMRAASTTAGELTQTDWALPSASDEKLNVAFTFQNTADTIVPAFADALDLYEGEMGRFAAMGQAVVASTAAINSVLFVGLAVFSYFTLHRILPRMQSKRLAVMVALRAPHKSKRTIREFYCQLEDQLLTSMEDGESQLGDLDCGTEAGLTDRDAFGNTGRIEKTIPDSPSPLVMADSAAMGSLAEVGAADAREGHGLHGQGAVKGAEAEEAEQLSSSPIGGAAGVRVSMRLTAHNLSHLQETLSRRNSNSLLPASPAPAPASAASPDIERSQQPAAAHILPCSHDVDLSARASRQPPLVALAAAAQLRSVLACEAELHADEERSAEEEQEEDARAESEQRTDAGAARGASLQGGGEEGEGEGEGDVAEVRAGTGTGSGEGSEGGLSPAPSGHTPNGAAKRFGAQAGVHWEPEKASSVSAHHGHAEAPALPVLRAGSLSQGGKQTLSQPPARGDEDSRSAASSPVRKGHNFRRRRSSVDNQSMEEFSLMREARRRSLAASCDGEYAPVDLDEGLEQELSKEMEKHVPWHSWKVAWVFMTGLILMFCLLSTIFPMRAVPDLHDMTPIIRQAGHRLPLVQTIIFLARELVLDDGLSRMRKPEIAHRIMLALDDLKATHEAVRLGGMGIKRGCDVRFEEHNTIMYERGCPWRAAGLNWDNHEEAKPVRRAEEEHDFTECTIEGWEDTGSNGLNHLMFTFYDVVRAVLDKHAPPGYRDWRQEEDLDEYATVRPNNATIAAVHDDANVQFLQHNKKQDLFSGLMMIQNVLIAEASHLVDRAHAENKLFYGLYAAAIIFVWYGVYFRSIVATAHSETANAQNFVARLPLKVLSPGEIMAVSEIFMPSGDENFDQEEPEGNAQA